MSMRPKRTTSIKLGAKELAHDAYTVGWLCALPKEMLPARVMLEEVHASLPLPPGDQNTYCLGSIAGHNVAIACLPKGTIGTNAAAITATRMTTTFPSIRFGLLVGIGGGIPSRDHDIRLGDVVVSVPQDQHGGVIQWDKGKTTQGAKFVRTGLLNKPPTVLTSALSKLSIEHDLEGSRCSEFISDMLERYPKLRSKYGPRDVSTDILYKAHYDHAGDLDTTCANCDRSKAVQREPREEEVVVHYGLIASGNQVIKHGPTRDEISREVGGALCIEMEAAGIMNDFPCIVIRGICDYADSHKNKAWQEYAAATAAAFAKELLHTIPKSQIATIKKVEEVLSSMTEKITDTVKQLHEKEDARTARREEDKLMQTLSRSSANYRDQLSVERVPDRVDGTCEWFLRNKQYINWLESKQSSLLWVSADPGCGKSVLAASLLRRELTQTQTRTTCYFLFKDDDLERKSAAVAFTAILHQLFTQKKSLREYAISEHQEKGAKLTEQESTLWEILTSAASDPQAGEIICVLDALDECEEGPRIRIINMLREYYFRPDSSARLKFLVTSRPYADIELGFRKLTNDFPTIRLSAEEETAAISREIDIVIKSRVEDIRIEMQLPDAVAAALETSLFKMTHRTYLYLKLIFDFIKNRVNATTEKRMRGIIEQIPESVDQAYEAILDRITRRKDPTELREAKRLLHFVVAAARPLTLTELSLALAINETTSAPTSYNDLDLEAEHLFKTRIRNTCGLFINIVDSKVYLLHQTAKEFLVRVGPDDNISGTWKHSLTPQDSSLLLAKTCLLYLMFDVFEREPPKLPDIKELFVEDGESDDETDEDESYGRNGEPEDKPESEAERKKRELGELYEAVAKEYQEKHAFLNYAANNWFHHVRDTDNAAILDMSLQILQAGSKRMMTWTYMNFIAEEDDDVMAAVLSPLGVAVSFRLPRLVERLISDGYNLRERDEFEMTPLSWAAQLMTPKDEDEAEFFKELDDEQESLRRKSRPGWNILYQLLAEAAQQAAKRRPRDLMLEEEYNERETQAAYSIIEKKGSEQRDLLGLLGVERREKSGDQKLRPHRTAIFSLLHRVTGVDMRSPQQRDGFHLEAQACCEIIISCLADIFSGKANEDWQSPSVTTILTELGSGKLDSIVPDEFEPDPDIFEDNMDEGVQYLVDLGEKIFREAVEIYAVQELGSGLDIAAAVGRQLTGVLMMTFFATDEDRADDYQPMDTLDYTYYIAIKHRYYTIFQILTANGPEANGIFQKMAPKPKYGNRLLATSLSIGDILATKALLEEGADPNSIIHHFKAQGVVFGVPVIFIAIMLGAVEIVRLLIRNGARLDSGGQEGTGALASLHMAAIVGDLAICNLLIDHGADVNAPILALEVYEGMATALAEILDRSYLDQEPGMEGEDAADDGVSENSNRDDGEDGWEDDDEPSNGTPNSTKDQAQDDEFIEKQKLSIQEKTEGGTVLHLAVALGFTELIELLATSKVDIKAKNKRGKSAVLVAKDTGDKESIRLVESIARRQRGKINFTRKL
ncbi:hypothetical protein ABW21_db0205360 [Orbilia brochopaga]|nr:hypothetical protein ABW21_db0205360 [Drechslerella brochopaga]